MHVLCTIEHAVGPPHIVQGSWSNIQSSLGQWDLHCVYIGVFSHPFYWYLEE